MQLEGERSTYVSRYVVPTADEYKKEKHFQGLYIRYYLRQCYAESIAASVGQIGRAEVLAWIPIGCVAACTNPARQYNHERNSIGDSRQFSEFAKLSLDLD
jgi:hypothetical protein